MKPILTIEDEAAIDRHVLDHYISHFGIDHGIVTDGIVNLKSYNDAKYRILWILKEVNEVGRAGEWSITKDLISKARDGDKLLMGLANTFTKIIYTTYGILHNLPWDGMDYTKDKPEMIDVLNSIAYINIKKRPGGSVAVGSELTEAYERDKRVILYQIESYDPDIIICGGTIGYLRSDLGLDEGKQYVGECEYYIQEDKLIIVAGHPASRVRSDWYVDGIVKAAQAFGGRS
jgi:hypothetical protein